MPSSRTVASTIALGVAVLIASVTPDRAKAGTVTIPDPFVRDAVYAMLELDPAAPLTEADMQQLTRLQVLGGGGFGDLRPHITTFSGLEHATNLVALTVMAFIIEDVSVIPTLTSLRELQLTASDQADVTPFSTMTWLEKLSLYNNGITDISGLASLTQLKHLTLHYNSIEDLTPLSSLENLEYLVLTGNSLASDDCGPLSSLTTLTTLGLFDNALDSVAFLEPLENLTELVLAENQVSDISPLVGMSNLSLLYLQDNLLNDAAYDQHLPQIEANNPGIDLQYDPIPEPTALLLLAACLPLIRRKRLRMRREMSTALFSMCLLTTVLGVTSTEALATDYTWNGDGIPYSWLDDENWTPTGVPSSGDNITIDGSLIGKWATVIHGSGFHEAESVNIGSYATVTHNGQSLTFADLKISGIIVTGSITSSVSVTSLGTAPQFYVTGEMILGENANYGGRLFRTEAPMLRLAP